MSRLKERKWKDKGLTAVHVCDEADGKEKIIKYFFFNSTPVGEFVFFTKMGIVKRTDLNEYRNLKKIGPALTLIPGDELLNVDMKVDGDETRVLLVTKGGMTLSYNIDEISLLGKKAQGTRGIKLKEKDELILGTHVRDEGEVVIGTKNGYFKRVIIPTLVKTNRGLIGTKITQLEITKNNKAIEDELLYVGVVCESYDILAFTSKKIEKINTEEIKVSTRLSSGEQMVKIKVDEIIPVLTDRID